MSHPVCSGSQGPPDGADAEEAERCPICLGVLAGGELAMPDSCCHVFCLRCLLTWAEVTISAAMLNLECRERRNKIAGCVIGAKSPGMVSLEIMFRVNRIPTLSTVGLWLFRM